VPQGHYDLAVTTSDPAVSAEVRDVDVASDSRLNVELAGTAIPPVHFSGHVVDGTGAPLAGVTINTAGLTTSTGEDGRFELQTAPGRFQLVVGLVQPGNSGDATIEVPTFDLTADRDVTVTFPFVGVDVTVDDSAGRSVDGASVSIAGNAACPTCLTGPTVPSGTGIYTNWNGRASTDAAGRVHMIGVPSDDSSMYVTALGKLPYRGLFENGTQPVTTVTLADAPPLPAPDAPTVTFSGRLLAADGSPYVGDAGISLNLPDGTGTGVELNTDGTFSAEVPAGWYQLHVALGQEDYQCCDERPETHERIFDVNNFDLRSDRHQDLTVPAAWFTVHVVGPDGAPVSGAWVKGTTDFNTPPTAPDVLFPGGAAAVSTLIDRPTDDQGNASMDFVPGALPPSITVDPPGGHGLSATVALDPAATGADVHLKPGVNLRGHITTGTSPRADIAHGQLVPTSGRPIPFTLSSDGSYIVTAPPGRYRLALDNSYRLEGESNDVDLWNVISKPFQLSADRTLDITVPLRYGGVSAVDANGYPIRELSTGINGSSTTTALIAPGLEATGGFGVGGPGAYDSFGVQLIAPSLAFFSWTQEALASLYAGVYVAPGEDTVIAFIPGTGPQPYVAPASEPSSPIPPTNQPPSGTGAGTGPAAPDPAVSTSATRPRGYWALGSDGHVYNFGDAAVLGNASAGAVDLEPTPTGNGYWILNHNGAVQAFGDAMKLGDVDTLKLAKGEEPASLSATPSGKGYWVFTNRGRVLAFGDASFLGDMSGTKLNGPVLGSVATPSGKGYYMVASDGGIFAFGDATFAGSMGDKKLNAPVQSLVPDGDGHGYWLVASDGGIFAFDAPFRGSMGGTRLNKPVVGMVRYGDGYLMVGADGGIFDFSSLPFSGSLGDKPPTSPVVAVAALP
jgi:protocatechuate 3,4-dioxygenase beta subunit